jgi:hypothetical protein
VASRQPSPRAEDVCAAGSYELLARVSSEHFACQVRRSPRKRPAAVLEDECGELVGGVGRAGLEPVRRRLELRRQFPKRLQRRPPLTGFDAADLRIGDARLAEVPLREAELSPPLPDAVTDRAWARRAPGQNGRELTLLLLLFACGVSRKPGCCCRFVECQSLA